MQNFAYFEDVVTLTLAPQKCVGCGLCVEVCPHAVLRLENGRVYIADRGACMECGACARNCPTAALDVRTGEGCAIAILNEMLGRKCECC